MAQLQEIGPMAILWFTVVSLFVTGLVTFGFKMYKIRSSVRKLQKQGLVSTFMVYPGLQNS